jgi:hypothetical protein
MYLSVAIVHTYLDKWPFLLCLGMNREKEFTGYDCQVHKSFFNQITYTYGLSVIRC